MNNPDVLIIGAGPTGLMMACQLAIQKIPFRIIDKNEDHTTQSRALVIQARSVEILDQMGLAEIAIQQGKIAKGIGAFFNGKRILHVVVNSMGEGLTRFPYLLMLEQSHTEAILVEFLKQYQCEVERNVELLSVSQNENGVLSVLRRRDGKEEEVKTTYVIGADGAHSIVRQQLKIPFGGKTYEESLFVMDCKAEVDIPNDEMYLTFANDAIGGFFPLTNGRWRILGNIPKSLEGKEKIEFEDIEKNYAQRVQMKVRLYDPQWVAVYRAHHRYASTFHQGNCFLVGDAAHIHSPVGAQGMNTGLQDAYNLAWKLALVIKGKANTSLLETYTEERITIARKLVGTTDRLFNMVTSENFALRTFRSYIVPVVLKVLGPVFQKMKFIQRMAFKIVSEIGINYRGNTLADNAVLGSFPSHAPKPGDRLPYIKFMNEEGNETSTHEIVKGSFFRLLFFGVEVPNDLTLFIEPFADIISIAEIPFSKRTSILYDRFDMKEGGFYLIRPDRYIAYRATVFNPEHLRNYLLKFLKEQ